MTKRTWLYQPHSLTFFWNYPLTMTFISRREELMLDTEFTKWCSENGCKINHTWVKCPDEKTATLFILRWS